MVLRRKYMQVVLTAPPKKSVSALLYKRERQT